MARYDLEDCLDDIEAILKDKLAAKITAIEAEKTAKGKGIALANVQADAFFRQTWSDKILNYDPGIFFGIENLEAVSGGMQTAERVTIFIECVIVDGGNDANTHRRVNRYSRAIREVCEENFDSLPFGSKIKIETVRPTSFKLELDSSEEIKVGGVSVSLTIV